MQVSSHVIKMGEGLTDIHVPPQLCAEDWYCHTRFSLLVLTNAGFGPNVTSMQLHMQPLTFGTHVDGWPQHFRQVGVHKAEGNSAVAKLNTRQCLVGDIWPLHSCALHSAAPSLDTRTRLPGD